MKHVDTTCFFCDKPGDELHQVMTFRLDQRVRKCASVTGDSQLLGKLVVGDMIATEAKYHPGCLLSLYRRASLMQSSGSEDTDASSITVPNSESLALAEVIAYIEDTNCSGETPSVFKLSELGNLYTELLQTHGVNLHAKLNISRFKDRLLAACPDLTAVAHGRDILLTFNENVGVALKQMTENSDSDALNLVHTAKLIRNELFSGEYTFKGTFEDSFSKTCSTNFVDTH